MTIPQLRPYQQDTYSDIHTLWSQGARNVALVLPTARRSLLVVDKPPVSV